MIRKLIWGFIALLMLVSVGDAAVQQTQPNGRVFATCTTQALNPGQQVQMAVDENGRLCVAATVTATATFTTPTGSYTDRSGAVTTGGTSQTLMAANGTRLRITIENPCSAATENIATAESLFINFTAAASGTAGGSIELTPCGSYDSASGPVSLQAITVTAATTAHRWIAKEM